MNVRIEDADSSDDGRPGPQHHAQEIRPPERLHLTRRRGEEDEGKSALEFKEKPLKPLPHYYLAEPNVDKEKKLADHRRRKSSRRHSSRKYPDHKTPDKYSPLDQDSDDVLDEYYGGDTMLALHARPTMPDYNPFAPDPYDPYVPSPFAPQPIGDDVWDLPQRPYGLSPTPRPTVAFESQPPPMMQYNPPPPHPASPIMPYEPPGGPPPPRPPRHTMFLDPEDGPGRRHSSAPLYRHSRDRRRTRVPDMLTIRTPPPDHNGGLWNRAATYGKTPDVMKLTLKLVLTRKGERYKGRPFLYETNSWDDVVFAHRLRREYRSLKTDQIGLMQKLTSYKTISFVYFLQYHAFEDVRFDFGRWEITNRVPIVPRQDEKARSFFMYQFKKRVRKESKILSTLAMDKIFPKKRPRDWIRRLETLIEPGAVIDIEVKETFDSMKIYFGLLLAVLLSLGVALAYGFVMDKDFSTGFSIGSWLLTAFGFFAAVVAAGEYLGLDGPTATLSAAEELRPGTISRELLDHRMYPR